MSRALQAQSLSSPHRYHLDALKAVFDRDAVIAAVQRSFVDHAAGRFVQASPVHLTFPGGDCHIKSGYSSDADIFTIKIATGFYGNDKVGLPNGNGLMLVFSQQTGLPLALLEDHGMLTAWRTAAATVIAARAGAPPAPLHIAIVGSGLQAELAARWLPESFNVASQRVWSRDIRKAAALASRIEFPTTAEPDLETLCRTANLIVTATPSTVPLVMTDWVCPGTHIVALGADNPGKSEVDPALFRRAAAILTDDHDQCLDHGDFGVAVRAGTIVSDADLPLGGMLARDLTVQRSPEAITIADLTGLATQDDAIARLFLQRLSD